MAAQEPGTGDGMTASPIPGVAWQTTARHGDARGAFREIWRASRLPEPFVQANVSTSAPGVLRGLHLHRRQLDFWTILSGRAFVALVDTRPLVRGTGDRPIVDAREVPEDTSIVIPAGVAHGFLALDDLVLSYLVTNEYDGTDELGFAWDDPTAAVPWPVLSMTPDGRPITSDRDRTNPSLPELVARLRG